MQEHTVKRKSPQIIRKDAVILSVEAPRLNTQVMIVPKHRFVIMEGNKTDIHYCSITDDKLYISSKAPYNYVIVNYFPAPKK